MGKKKYNFKARQVVNTTVDNTLTNQIQIESSLYGGCFDEQNQLVLPSTKRPTAKEKKAQTVKILSRKKRKQLEKIVENKKKKQNRSSLLDALAKVQATSEEIKNLTSIATVQSKGLKRYLYENSNPGKSKKSKQDLQILSGEVKLNSLSGAKRLQLLNDNNDKSANNDPNIVGFESSDTENDSELEVADSISSQNGDDAKIEDEPVNKVIPIKTELDSKEIINHVQKENDRKPSVYVDVNRDDDIQKARLKLPILAEEQQIMELINEHPVIIIAGETGSGKTTQIPQFLYEAGYALKKQIGVTEPRRVAATAMSKRVAEEMNLGSQEVSYLIRFEGNVTDNTKIKFMTDGVLLKEVQTDFLLSKYSVIILDEAHERSVYTDILIGLLSRIVPLRHKRGDPLKLIIMSATLRIEDFTLNRRLFKVTPPVFKVDSRQFPVTIHFNKRTQDNYLAATFDKAVKIHTKLPEGGILIFLTGQQEVNNIVKKLRKKFPLKAKQLPHDENKFTRKKGKLKKVEMTPEIDIDSYSQDWFSDQELDYSTEDDDDDDPLTDNSPMINCQPLWVLPLYSLLPTYKQNEVFKPPPDGCRLCIVSTNVAETSLTIPNIKYVVDCGKSKVKLYDKVTGVTSYVVTWTSKASADQRAGRAGRTGPGHCYRLYSSAVFNDTFKQFSDPEIQQKPVDDLYLQMKCMNIDKVVNFPFPTAPDLLQLKTAAQRLEVLGALKEGDVTPLGKAIAKFPVLPRFGKMLALSHQHDILPYTICLVAALSVQEVLLERPILSTDDQSLIKEWTSLRKKWVGSGNYFLLGDNMVLLKAVGAAEHAHSQNCLEKFCNENGLRQKAIIEIRKLRIQLSKEIKLNLPEANVILDLQLVPLSDLQAKLLRQVLLSGMGDQIAKKIEAGEGENHKKLKYAYHANNMEQPVFIHSSSVLKNKLPEFVIYNEIYETNKIYMRGVTVIDVDWLPIYVPNLCNLSEPLTEPEPRYNPSNGKIYCSVSGSFGSQGWLLPCVEIEHPLTINYYKLFGKFLLEGEIFPKLKKYKDILLSQPTIMVKSWAKLQPRTDVLLKGLIAKEIISKEKLEEIWRKESKYLLEEYLRWVPQSAYGEISLMWPPL